jgi:hypothetical protein
MTDFQITDAELTGFKGKVAIVTGTILPIEPQSYVILTILRRWFIRHWSRHSGVAFVPRRKRCQRRHSEPTSRG